tara:strand:- start:1859 stop:2701 length:843 start_codon:yes stop_codon:yes gene_type:complete
MNILQALNNANKKLKEKGIKSYHLDSQILISEALKVEKKNILLNLEKKVSMKKLDYFDFLVTERINKKPIAYILRKKEFWKYDFFVNQNVLIPRPETELIIENVLELTKNKSKLNILDIGVGSGCIILSILKERKNFNGTGIDVCKKSLNICKINSYYLEVSSRLKLFKSDVDNFQNGKYDLIVSNPPYIKKSILKYLEKDVIGFEPKLALDGGNEGLSVIRKVIERSSKLIKKKGFLILEIAYDQKKQVKKILMNKGFFIKKIVKDLSGNDRCIISLKI